MADAAFQAAPAHSDTAAATVLLVSCIDASFASLSQTFSKAARSILDHVRKPIRHNVHAALVFAAALGILRFRAEAIDGAAADLIEFAGFRYCLDSQQSKARNMQRHDMGHIPEFFCIAILTTL